MKENKISQTKKEALSETSLTTAIPKYRYKPKVSEKAASGSRVVYIDYLKILACFGVILSHSLATPLTETMFTTKWYVVNALLGIVTPCVGIFFMVSGAMVLSSRNSRSIKYLFTHRLPKIGIPFLILAGLTMAVFNEAVHDFSFNAWLEKMLSIYHQYPTVAFWFMYPLFGFYILSPLMKVFVDNSSLKIIDYILGIWFVTNILFPFIAAVVPKQYAGFFSYLPAYNMIFLGQVFGYFLLGYRLHKAPIKYKSTLLNFLLIVAIALFTIFINILNNKHITNIPVVGSDSLVVMFFAVAIFWAIKKWSFNHPISLRVQQFTTTLSNLSYGIYLTHGIVMMFVDTILGVKNFFMVFLVTSLFCMILTYTISKIPKIRYILLGIN
ncbi:acyltransferase [Companilactobacillus mishanensis]|uniref:Acyltransferase n=1 Tax=Companilactobacillus mishanensis TaxID=2486008 RepID=A0A5P0ZHU3_9LACO|nr:acyltransferase [Companilactobacillus mishanensis]MQS52646.1 acyltransferase [Companilactobacillus mishanensis]